MLSESPRACILDWYEYEIAETNFENLNDLIMVIGGAGFAAHLFVNSHRLYETLSTSVSLLSLRIARRAEAIWSIASSASISLPVTGSP